MVVVSIFFVKVAKEELREDDCRKSQALAQFRGILSKHPAIKKCRTGKKIQFIFVRLNSQDNNF